MQEAIRKNKLRYIRENAQDAVFDDLVFAFESDNMEAVFLLYEPFRKELQYRCFYKLSPDEYDFLGGLDPRDMTMEIQKMTR